MEKAFHLSHLLFGLSSGYQLRQEEAVRPSIVICCVKTTGLSVKKGEFMIRKKEDLFKDSLNIQVL